MKTLSPKPTPIFMRDNVYHKIYDLIKHLILKYPILSGEFDVNAFGVRDTYEVYEYWGFYKILTRLIELGFRPKEKNFTTDELGKKIPDDRLLTTTEWLDDNYILDKIGYCNPHQIGAVDLTLINFNMFNSLLKLIFEYKEKLIWRKIKLSVGSAET